MFNVGSVQGYLKLNTSGWTGPMKSAGHAMTSLSRTFMRTGAVMLAKIAIIEREFGKFDKAIRHATSVTLTLTEEQFKEMSTMALDASVRWNKAAADTAQAFYFLGSAGLTATEQMQAFNDTIMLSRAMGADLSATVEGMVDIVRAFGLEFSDVTNIADQLTYTITSSNQMFQDLDKALSYASSTARLTNNTLAETNAMLGIMANAGIKGSMAGTVLRRAMTNLMSPTAGMGALMYELGLRIYDATGQMKPFIDIIGQISDKLVGTTDAYKNMVFEVLFGRRAIAGQITLFNYGSVALRKYADEIKNAGGTTQKVADKQMKAFAEVLGQLYREVQRVYIALGELLAPAIERVANSIRYSMAIYRNYIKVNKDAIKNTMKWTVVLSTMAILLPPIVLILTGLVTQFVAITTAMVKMGVAMALTPFTYLLVALYALRVTLGTDFWKKAWENQIKPFLSNMGGGFTQTLTQIMWEFSLIPDAVDKAFSAQGALNTVLYFTKALQQVGLVVRQIAAAALGDFKKMYSLAAEAEKLNEEMRVLMFGERGQGMFGSEEERIKSYQEYSKSLKIVGKELVWQGKEIATDFGKILKETMEKDFKAIMGLSEKLLSALPASVQGIIEQIKGALDELSNIYRIFMYEPSGIKGLLLPAVELDIVKQKLRAFYKKWRDEDMETVTGMRTNISLWAAQWKIAMDKVFIILATEIPQWADKIESALNSIQSKWADTMDSFINDTATMARTVENFVENMFRNILEAFNRTMAEIAANELRFALFGGGREYGIGRPGIFTGYASIWSMILGRKNESPVMEWPGLPSGEREEYVPKFSFSSRKMAGGDTKIEINNNTDKSLRETGRRFDGKQYVISMVMEELSNNTVFAKAMRGD